MTNQVLQSGTVTPGHFATWTTDGVIQDAGALLAAQKVLATIRGANFNSTSDQALVLPPAITAFSISSIIVTNTTISLATAVGGFYPAAAKTGTPIVANTQVYSTLTDATKLMTATLASFGSGTRFSIANLTQATNGGLQIFLSLTTANGNNAFADVYLTGMDLT